MKGMDVNTGKAVSDEEHLVQSIRDIITTPIGSRVMRRNYGCRIFHLIDQPINQLIIARIQAAVSEALHKYEPRVRFTKIKVDEVQNGSLVLYIEGYWVGNNQFFKLSNFRV